MSEGKVAEWLASLDNIPKGDVKAFLKVFVETFDELGNLIGGLQRQIDELKQKVEDHEALAPSAAHAPEMKRGDILAEIQCEEERIRMETEK